MKKILLLFVAAALAACSAEPVETEGVDSLNAAVAGKNKTAFSTTVVDVRNQWTYSNNGGLDQGQLTISNDCDSVTLQFVELDGESLEEVEFTLTTTLPELNNGGNMSGSLPYGFGDLDENLSFTISFTDLGITAEDNLYVFAKAWGKWAGLSSHGKLSYFTYDVQEVDCGCEERFSYNNNGNGTYTFFYVPGEDLGDADLTFTFPQDIVDSFPEPFTPNGAGNDTTFSAEIDLTACESYSWTFGLSTDCRGEGQNYVNLWNDFKVGEDSKRERFGLEKIRVDCE